MLEGILTVISVRNAFSLCTGFCIFLISIYNFFPGNLEGYTEYYRGMLIKQEVCQIPELNPFDPSILSLLQKPAKLECKKLQEDLVSRKNKRSLEIVRDVSEKFGQNGTKCQYRCFARQIENDFDLKFDEWTNFTNNLATPSCEFVEVECKKVTFPYTTIFTDVFSFIPKVAPEKGKRKGKFDVILFVIDSLSHSNAIRNLPQTMEILQKKYKSYTLNGLTKVGDNSFPNAAAFLTGKRVRVNGYEGELPDDMTGQTYDQWPIVWRNFSNKGYKTYYAEDYSDFNLFAYLANGFKKKPVDHYFRPFWLNVYKNYLHRRSTPLCYGNRKMHKMQINYLSEYLHAYASHPKFALNWLTEIGHDFMHIVNVADGDFADFFERHYPLLKDSFLFVMGDHGHRFDAIRRTLTGRLEERLPLVTIHLPETLQEKRPDIVEAIKWNQDRLTSFFDIHATLEEILLENENYWEIQKATSRMDSSLQRGLSLLHKIPKKRSCAEAGVPEEFCVCQMEVSIDPNEEIIQNGAKFLLEHVNAQVEKLSECLRFELDRIYYAQRILPNKRALLSGSFTTMGGEVDGGKYRIAIKTRDPSRADFEALIRFDSITNFYEVIGDVNRINKYGQAGDCIDRVNLRKFCYCH